MPSIHHSKLTLQRSESKPRIFYGWYVLAASVVIELFGLGFGIFAITTVYPYIIDTFPSWSRTTVFAPTSVVITTVGVLSPLTGILVDRYPIRRMFFVGICIQSLGLFLFSRVQTPFEYFATSTLVGIGMSTVTILPNQVLVSRWFHERVGLVNGVILAATALGAAIAPALITRVIEVSDWRTAFAWLSLLAFGPPMLVTLLVVRDRPEVMGLQPYSAAPSSTAATTQSGHPSRTLADALRVPMFWALFGAIFFGGMPCYSFNKHILVQLKELGYTTIQAADYKSLFFLIAACGRLSFGWLCDRFDKRRMMLAHFACIACGYPLLLLVPEHRQLLLPCLVVVGIGYGGLLPSMPILAVHYFGRAHLGKILGVYKIGYDVAAATAPLFTAYLYDTYRSYLVPDAWNSLFAWVGLALVAFGLRGHLLEPQRSLKPAL